ncbi:hypothetical protein LRAMOSA09369 [Lichtheimia ramosa]|uniref:Phosphatidic acid phosphatase type 2/haloperoxidase domain-containing protein n=1 Tax=Lichtheimia ramosa TaxID=688394 RepID=A0A077WI50_9FUNG|nr:hypothetical protein LRAMOSA09369 [Lichtheimia ramosa]
MLGIQWENPRTQRAFYSYSKDWLLVLLMLTVFFAIDLIMPFHRQFSVEDKSLMYAFTEHETVPAWSLVLICLLGPALLIGIISIHFQKSTRDFFIGVLGLFLALSMTIMLTDIIKITAGRPRPDFLARCKPPLDVVDPPLGLSDYTICTTPIDSYIMRDGFKSFPSGHSSFSFAGLGYFAFYLAGKMHIFDERGHTYKCFLFAFPCIAALLVAISRTRDNRHHWQDVLVGSLLGAACAYFAYRQYYPSLIVAECELPYNARFGSIDLPEEERPIMYQEEDEEANLESVNRCEESSSTTTQTPSDEQRYRKHVSNMHRDSISSGVARF